MNFKFPLFVIQLACQQHIFIQIVECRIGTVCFIFKINIVIQIIAFDRKGRCLSCFFFQFMEFILFNLHISIGFLNRFIKHI